MMFLGFRGSKNHLFWVFFGSKNGSTPRPKTSKFATILDFQTPCQKSVFCMVLVVFAKPGVPKMTGFLTGFWTGFERSEAKFVAFHARFYPFFFGFFQGVAKKWSFLGPWGSQKSVILDTFGSKHYQSYV